MPRDSTTASDSRSPSRELRPNVDWLDGPEVAGRPTQKASAEEVYDAADVNGMLSVAAEVFVTLHERKIGLPPIDRS